MDIDQWIVTCGIASFAAVALTTICRQRKLEASDIGAFLAAYMSGCNLPAAIFLGSYAFYPDPPTVATKLHGSEKYVSMAGIALFSLAIIGIWLLLKKAYERSDDIPQNVEST
ncbi:MAG: hypothetical protein JO295_11390 [Verrucomicrobia bacterium]|nr:hypothetical protein [Verrucomicrobiota bacterium]